MLTIKRVYEPASPDDGLRILVDRLWPRGLSKEAAKIDRWAKELSPSTELRRRFHGNPEAWDEFVAAYRAELSPHRNALRDLAAEAAKEKVTLLYAAKDEAHNNAVALKAFLSDS